MADGSGRQNPGDVPRYTTPQEMATQTYDLIIGDQTYAFLHFDDSPEEMREARNSVWEYTAERFGKSELAERIRYIRQVVLIEEELLKEIHINHTHDEHEPYIADMMGLFKGIKDQSAYYLLAAIVLTKTFFLTTNFVDRNPSDTVVTRTIFKELQTIDSDVSHLTKPDVLNLLIEGAI